MVDTFDGEKVLARRAAIHAEATDGSPSILFLDPADRRAADAAEVPDVFADLNLDQVVDAITVDRPDYDLKPFWYVPVSSVAALTYRHEIFREFETGAVEECVRSFAGGMRFVREHLQHVGKLRYKYQRELWFLDAAKAYCDAVQGLADALTPLELHSSGFRVLRDYVCGYAGSEQFSTLVADTTALRAGLTEVRYTINIRGARVTVSDYADEPDYSADIEANFERFKQGTVRDYLSRFGEYVGMDHVEAQILGLVARLHQDLFTDLDRFCAVRAHFLDDTIVDFDREVQFYLAYLDYIGRLEITGLPFCYPMVSDRSKDILARDAFDLALANKLVREGQQVVCNDCRLTEPERLIVVSGPNQGGKTTFARTFGELHYLARLGCPVPGREARLFFYDELFTHFEKQEDVRNIAGKLQDDLNRIHDVLEAASPDSVIILNEIFTSTTLNDAVFLGTKVLQRIAALDALCVCVTFVDELASLTESTVSMMSTVEPDNPARRTFKVVRQPADGLSYAASIAEMYGLTYRSLKGRLGS